MIFVLEIFWVCEYYFRDVNINLVLVNVLFLKSEFVNFKVIKACVLVIFLYLINIFFWDEWFMRSFVCCLNDLGI